LLHSYCWRCIMIWCLYPFGPLLMHECSKWFVNWDNQWMQLTSKASWNHN
jgi:hypothetical protein